MIKEFGKVDRDFLDVLIEKKLYKVIKHLIMYENFKLLFYPKNLYRFAAIYNDQNIIQIIEDVLKFKCTKLQEQQNVIVDKKSLLYKYIKHSCLDKGVFDLAVAYKNCTFIFNYFTEFIDFYPDALGMEFIELVSFIEKLDDKNRVPYHKNL